MKKTPFYSVHKDFLQDGPVYGHEEFLGLSREAAYSKFHQLLASVYASSDPWSHVFIVRDDGVFESGEVVDKRISET